MSTRRTGAVIVTHNSAAWISLCLERLVRHCSEIVVFDNCSTDGTVEEAKRHAGVRVIESPRNLGFAGGVNRGIENLEADRILILNPDVLLETPLDPLETEIGRPGVGAAAGVLCDAQNRPQAGFTVRRFPTAQTLAFEALGLNRIWPSNPVNRHYRCADLDLRKPQEPEQPAGAFVLIRREVWEQLGGWDERFHPVWFEDVDFFLRMRRAGWTARLAPEVRAIHAGGHSVNRLDPGIRRSYWYGSLLRYSAKHLGPFRTRFVAVAVLVGAAVRFVLGKFGGAGQSGEYDTVMRLAARTMLWGSPDAEDATAEAHDPEEANKGLRTRHLHGL
jgi:GT2 family glycosyltransferase